jgi:F0F1-type ATP synthase epsilon subunit
LASGQKRYFFVDGGVAQMKDNKLTLLSTDAAPASLVSAETARAEYAEAEARRPTDAKAAADRQHQMARARAKQAVAGKQ